MEIKKAIDSALGTTSFLVQCSGKDESEPKTMQSDDLKWMFVRSEAYWKVSKSLRSFFDFSNTLIFHLPYQRNYKWVKPRHDGLFGNCSHTVVIVSRHSIDRTPLIIYKRRRISLEQRIDVEGEYHLSIFLNFKFKLQRLPVVNWSFALDVVLTSVECSRRGRLAKWEPVNKWSVFVEYTQRSKILKAWIDATDFMSASQ